MTGDFTDRATAVLWPPSTESHTLSSLLESNRPTRGYMSSSSAGQQPSSCQKFFLAHCTNPVAATTLIVPTLPRGEGSENCVQDGVRSCPANQMPRACCDDFGPSAGALSTALRSGLAAVSSYHPFTCGPAVLVSYLWIMPRSPF